MLLPPVRYQMTYNPTSFHVVCPADRSRFSGLAAAKRPKVYAVSRRGLPFYVGATMQSMGGRLRTGWTADGLNGYHGYQWRHHHSNARLDVWAFADSADIDRFDLEAIEAEVVFLIRVAGQWPVHQTEIHFRRSTKTHRRIAKQIFEHYC
jgi:hypothetical protein